MGRCMRRMSSGRGNACGFWRAVHPCGDVSAEFRLVLRAAWKAFHSRNRIWSVPRNLPANMWVCYMSVFPRNEWASGTRFFGLSCPYAHDSDDWPGASLWGAKRCRLLPDVWPHGHVTSGSYGVV